jgi:hypothetical protein
VIPEWHILSILAHPVVRLHPLKSLGEPDLQKSEEGGPGARQLDPWGSPEMT